jgi:opacity protein-like surface antigen
LEEICGMIEAHAVPIPSDSVLAPLYVEADLLDAFAIHLPAGASDGWLVGAGFEYAFTNNWTVKFEYDYLGLGNRTVNISAAAPDLIAGDTFTSNNLNIQMVKVGVNYLFNWGAPAAARY